MPPGRCSPSGGLRQGVADEGGWWPAFGTNEEALDVLVRAIERAGYGPGDEVSIALDVAASEFGATAATGWVSTGASSTATGLARCWWTGSRAIPILSIEDPFAEDDREGFRRFTAGVGDRVQVVGDDL